MEEVLLVNRSLIICPHMSSFIPTNINSSSRAFTSLHVRGLRLRASCVVSLHKRLSSPSSLLSPMGPPSPPRLLRHDHDDDEESSLEYGFREKVLFLDSYMDMDSFDVTSIYPQIVSAPLEGVKSIVEYLGSMGFPPIQIRRICFMCPEVLASSPAHLFSVFTFLLREARVKRANIRQLINRRPRLLVLNVEECLRPTLYFLRMLGIMDTGKHATLLSCSVEDTLIPKIHYFEGAGFSPEDARSMFRKFPALFCYSIEENIQPKFNFCMMEMERDLQELKRFPRYFSFSLQHRIVPRHQACKEKGLLLPLPILLKPGDEHFWARFKVCQSSSLPPHTHTSSARYGGDDEQTRMGKRRERDWHQLKIVSRL